LARGPVNCDPFVCAVWFFNDLDFTHDAYPLAERRNRIERSGNALVKMDDGTPLEAWYSSNGAGPAVVPSRRRARTARTPCSASPAPPQNEQPGFALAPCPV
jgi:hypothetical protein